MDKLSHKAGKSQLEKPSIYVLYQTKSECKDVIDVIYVIYNNI